ncbi:MAG: hypothetical protein F6J93_06975 [Oscillatoria sp. SIO1A7]|nr:hypothetical protein [Oscillatoria sp. SIO1A7]
MPLSETKETRFFGKTGFLAFWGRVGFLFVYQRQIPPTPLFKGLKTIAPLFKLFKGGWGDRSLQEIGVGVVVKTRFMAFFPQNMGFFKGFSYLANCMKLSL